MAENALGGALLLGGVVVVGAYAVSEALKAEKQRQEAAGGSALYNPIPQYGVEYVQRRTTSFGVPVLSGRVATSEVPPRPNTPLPSPVPVPGVQYIDAIFNTVARPATATGTVEGRVVTNPAFTPSDILSPGDAYKMARSGQIATMKSKKISRHFYWREVFVLRSEGEIKSAAQSVFLNAARHAQNLDKLRDAYGASLQVTSWYRAPASNAAAGGSKTSEHMIGSATDFNAMGMGWANMQKLKAAGCRIGWKYIGQLGISKAQYSPQNLRIHFATGKKGNYYYGPTGVYQESLGSWSC